MTLFRARPFLRSAWVAFAGVCLLALVLRIPIAPVPLERDEGAYAYMAQRWMQGDVPYRDTFDKKPPGAFAVYALVERVIGTSPAAVHWGMQLYTLGTLAVIFVLGRRLSSTTGGLAAAAFAAFAVTAPGIFGNSANTEVLMILPLTAAMLAAYYAVERQSLPWAFVTGVCAGLGLLFKQVALSNVVFYAVFVTWYMRRRPLAAPTLLLGVLTMPALAGAYFALHGAWGALVDATIGHSWAYASQLALARYPGSLWQTLPDVLLSFWPLVLLAGLQIVCGCWRAALSPTSRLRWNTLWMLLWLCASFAGTVTGGYFRQHYYVQLIPPLAVLAGMAVNLLSGQLPRPALRRTVALGLVVVPIGIGILSNLWYYFPGDVDATSERLYGTPLFAGSVAVGAFIADRSRVQDSVFVLGSEPQILYYAARRSATRYIILDSLTGPFPDARQRQLETLSEVQRNDPRFIVTVFSPGSFAAGPETPGDIFEGTRELINRSYHLAGVIEVSPSDRARPLVSGAEADAAWVVSPAWYGGPSWCALAVWERVPPAVGADRAAAEAESRAGGDLSATGDTEGAIARYREAIRRDPNFGAAHNNLAAALAKAGRVDEAIAEYTEAIRLSPLRAEPHWNLGVVLQEAGRLPQAIAQFRAAVFFNPLAEMRYRLAAAYTQAGQLREAQVELEQLLHEHPDSNGAEARMAWLLATANDERLRNGPRAVQLAEDAAQRTQHRDANVLNSLAAAYAEVGRYADAAAVAAQAIEVAPSSGQAGLRDALARRLARYRAGQPVRDTAGAPAP